MKRHAKLSNIRGTQPHIDIDAINYSAALIVMHRRRQCESERSRKSVIFCVADLAINREKNKESIMLWLRSTSIYSVTQPRRRKKRALTDHPLHRMLIPLVQEFRTALQVHFFAQDRISRLRTNEVKSRNIQ